VELQSRVDDLKRRGLTMTAVSYDARAVLADFASRRAITFPLLSDPGSPTIRAYGLLNTTVQPGTLADGVPFPGVFVLDANGRVTGKFFEQAYQERYTVSSMLVKLGQSVERPAAETVTPHLRARASATDGAVVPGRRISLMVDIVPNGGIHVYAPGAEGYRPIALVLNDATGVANGETVYPKAEPYVFKPLKETVPVFKAPFRLVRDITFQRLPPPAAGSGPAPQTVTISGRLDYQACDDRVCFNPVSIPLSWSFEIGALDRERSGAKR